MSERRDYTAKERARALKQLASRKPDVRAQGIAALCTMFEPLVKSQAQSYQQVSATLAEDDLIQVARVGLLEACASYKPRRGMFPLHAKWCIRNELSKYVESLANPVRLPAWMVRRLSKLRRMIVQMAHELLREPTSVELAERMKMPVYAIETMIAHERGPEPLPRWVDDSGEGHARGKLNWNRIHTRERQRRHA